MGRESGEQGDGVAGVDFAGGEDEGAEAAAAGHGLDEAGLVGDALEVVAGFAEAGALEADGMLNRYF